MNSLGSSSKWPSYNPLPSTLTFVLSESEQTEDEADVFSEGEGDSGKGKSPSAGDGLTFSGGYLDFRPYPDQRCARSRRDQSKRCADGSIHPNSASSPGAATLGSSSATPGDLAFAQKVSSRSLIRASISQCLFHPNSRTVPVVNLDFLFIFPVRRFAQVHPSFAWTPARTEDRTIWQR